MSAPQYCDVVHKMCAPQAKQAKVFLQQQLNDWQRQVSFFTANDNTMQKHVAWNLQGRPGIFWKEHPGPHPMLPNANSGNNNLRSKTCHVDMNKACGCSCVDCMDSTQQVPTGTKKAL